MTSKIKAQSDGLMTSRSHDEVVMEVLDRLDDLRGLAIDTGDQLLADDLAEVFESFLTRYCDSRHTALDTRMRSAGGQPKAFMH